MYLWSHFRKHYEWIFHILLTNNYQMHELNILLVKFYFNNFDNGIFLFSPYGIMLIFTWFLTCTPGPLHVLMFFGKIHHGLDPGRGGGVTGDRYHRGPSFTIFLRPESFSNKLNVGADQNCNKKGGVFMYDSCTSMLEI